MPALGVLTFLAGDVAVRLAVVFFDVLIRDLDVPQLTKKLRRIKAKIFLVIIFNFN